MKSKEIIIREFAMDDYDQVVELWKEAGIHYRPNGRESRSHMAKELLGGQAIFLVAVAYRKVVGVVLGTHDGRKGWINRLAVARGFPPPKHRLKNGRCRGIPSEHHGNRCNWLPD